MSNALVSSRNWRISTTIVIDTVSPSSKRRFGFNRFFFFFQSINHLVFIVLIASSGLQDRGGLWSNRFPGSRLFRGTNTQHFRGRIIGRGGSTAMADYPENGRSDRAHFPRYARVFGRGHAISRGLFLWVNFRFFLMAKSNRSWKAWEEAFEPGPNYRIILLNQWIQQFIIIIYNFCHFTISRQTELPYLRRASRRSRKNRRRVRRFWDSHGQDQGSAARKEILDQNVPSSCLFQEWQSSPIRG